MKYKKFYTTVYRYENIFGDVKSVASDVSATMNNMHKKIFLH